MEYKGLILSAKCGPTDVQLRNYSKYRHIEIALPAYLLERRHRSRRDRTINLVKKWKRMRDLELSVHAPYNGAEGSMAYYYRAYDFTRKIDGNIMIYHPSRTDEKFNNNNGIPVAVEIMKRLCNPPDVLRYLRLHGIRHIAFDGEHAVAAGLPLRQTFAELMQHVIQLHHANTSARGYHDNIQGGKIPMSDYRHILKKVRERIPGAPNVIEVREDDYDFPVRTEENMRVLMSLIDSLPPLNGAS